MIMQVVLQMMIYSSVYDAFAEKLVVPDTFGYSLNMILFNGIGTGVKDPGAKFHIAGIKMGKKIPVFCILYPEFVDSDDECVPQVPPAVLRAHLHDHDHLLVLLSAALHLVSS